MNPDIIVLGANASNGLGGVAADPTNQDFTNKPAAANGSCDMWGKCQCASNGQNGGPGNPGHDGNPGGTPVKGPTLCIIVSRLQSDLIVQTKGGDGGDGGPGSNGTNGGAGQDSGTNDSYCLEGHWLEKPACKPATGGMGGDAGLGGTGGPGGSGGDGGDIYIYYCESQSVSPGGAVYQIHGMSVGGQVGKGGGPGIAGQPGPGGKNEAVSGQAQTNAPSGNPKINGDWGTNGARPGDPGHVQAVYLPANSL